MATMEFKTKVAKVGNSHRVLIPKAVIDYLGWKDETKLKLRVNDHTVTLESA